MKDINCSIIIPHFNQVNNLETCLNSINTQDYNSNYEVIIVDNGTKDPSYDKLKSKFPHYQFIVELSRQNPYTCRNKGIKMCNGEYIGFLDAKCVPKYDWLSKTAEMTSMRAPISVGCYELSCHSEQLKDNVYGLLYLNSERNVKKEYGVTASNLLVHRSVFEKIGKFEDEHISGNDIMWSRKALEAGFSIQYCPEAKVSYPAQSWDDLSYKIIKYAQGVRFHEALSYGAIIRQFLPMRWSTFQEGIKHRQLIGLSLLKKMKLWGYTWVMKMKFGRSYLKASN